MKTRKFRSAYLFSLAQLHEAKDLEALSQLYGQPFVIENRVGGDGIIGAEACAKAPADGHTLLVGAAGTIASSVFRFPEQYTDYSVIASNTANGQELRAISVASASAVLDPNSSYGIIPSCPVWISKESFICLALCQSWRGAVELW